MIAEFFNKYLVDDWKRAWKWFSMWAFIIVAFSPEIYELAVKFGIVSAGHLPAVFERLVQWVGFFGAVSRLVDQKAVAERLALFKSVFGGKQQE